MLYSELNISEALHKAVDRMGFVELTEVQELAIPPFMQGRDVIAKAPTGTGKTCAFGIPLLMELDPDNKAPQAVILAPTRELAQQITEDLNDLAHFMPEVRIACLYGGQAIQKQVDQLKKGPQVIVATPGRLMDHQKRRNVDLRGVTYVVLDEADEMLDMGFYKDVKKILDSLKNKKQLGMFSATISREVMDISWLYQRDPEEITVRPVNTSAPKIRQYAIRTTGRDKLADVCELIVSNNYQRVIIFCNTKYITGMLSNQLHRLNFNVDCLHGDLSQAERNKIMQSFKEGKLRVLVATDVAARGIDVDDVEAVINYDLPQNAEYYTHRIGRTARAGREGAAYLLYMPDEEKAFKELVRLTRSNVIPVHFDENRKLVED